jgi:predicted amidophosphoribosyltransferase
MQNAVMNSGSGPVAEPPPWWWSWLAAAGATLVPAGCAGCGVDAAEVAVRAGVCPVCRVMLHGRPFRVPDGPPGIPVTAALEYAGAVARVLGAVKERGRTDALASLAPALSSAVSAAVRAAEDPVLLEVLAVPSAPAAVRKRGFRPVSELLRRAGHPPSRSARLVVARAVRDQAGLSAAERSANLHGALRAEGRLAGQRVLLIDDVMTTGATLQEAARAVAAAGGEVVAAACLAHTPRRRGPSATLT